MGESRRVGLQQRMQQSAQHVQLWGDGAEKIQSIAVADQQRRKGFDVQITDQISLVFYINPYKLAIRIGW